MRFGGNAETGWVGNLYCVVAALDSIQNNSSRRSDHYSITLLSPKLALRLIRVFGLSPPEKRRRSAF